jgi:hypothetical protein
MTICLRCGWIHPTDCTCRWQDDPLAALRLRNAVERRHQEAVARAMQSGRRPAGGDFVGEEPRAAG